jgi:pyridinium-3,5-bisthiocarboxylic acid mononucleotide nickel chelatase
MSDSSNIECSPFSRSHMGTEQEPQSWLDLWGPYVQQGKHYHAHFDCFSGIAGDMILASCIDAAGPDAPSSDQLLKLVDVCIRKGLPELDGEFELQKHRVWRGSGQIAATHITVHSRYDKLGGAPLPLKASQESGPTTTATTTTMPPLVDVHEQQQQRQTFSPSISPVPSSMGSHTHAHDHGHEHGHDHHSHSHEHQHQQPTLHSSLSSQNFTAVAAVSAENRSHSHSHGGQSHGAHGPLRNLPEIRRMLHAAPEAWIPSWVRKQAVKSFTLLALAEAEVHGADSIDSVHFHEVGAVDSIVDMVGSLIALHALGVRSVSCSRLPIGEGHVKTDQ